MPFTPEERRVVTAILQSYGWQLRDGVLWSPSGGLYFNDAHFAQWDPGEMSEVFERRGSRIEAQQPAQKAAIAEHNQVCKAIALAKGGRESFFA
jgi:hypothetical protein